MKGVEGVRKGYRRGMEGVCKESVSVDRVELPGVVPPTGDRVVLPHW